MDPSLLSRPVYPKGILGTFSNWHGESLPLLSSTFVFLALSLTTAEDEELCIIIICPVALTLTRASVRNG
jgi:hypothetical protein